MGLQGTLKGDMTGTTTHQTHKVVVLFGTRSIDHYIAYKLAVHLGGGIKPKGNGDVGVFEVAVDGFGDTDTHGFDVFLEEVLSNDL